MAGRPFEQRQTLEMNCSELLGPKTIPISSVCSVFLRIRLCVVPSTSIVRNERVPLRSGVEFIHLPRLLVSAAALSGIIRTHVPLPLASYFCSKNPSSSQHRVLL